MAKTKNSDITLSMRELDRLKIVQAVLDGLLKPCRAAERLKLTDRQFRRLVQRYRLEGAHGLLSKHRGRRRNNRTAPELESHAASLIRERYPDFGPTLACEKLVEVHGLVLAKETVRRLMIEAELWVPRKQRPPKIHQPRNRRACIGELIQIDGCEHAWFELRGPTCTALVYVDDATSRLMEVYFTTSESTFSYFKATRAHVERTEIDQGAIVDNKRLGKVLEIVQLVQEKRDNRRSLCVPVEEGPPRKRGQPPGKKPQLALDRDDLSEAIRKTKENRTSERGRRGTFQSSLDSGRVWRCSSGPLLPGPLERLAHAIAGH